MKASLNTLALYSEARTALTLLKKTDEILDVRDKMRALEFYGEQIHDTSLASAAAEVKIRAERRFGQVVRALEKAGKLPMGGRPKKRAAKQRDKNPSPTAGASRRQKANSRKLADMPEDKFEGALARQKDGKRKPTVKETLAAKETRQINKAIKASSDVQHAAAGLEFGLQKLDGVERKITNASPKAVKRLGVAVRKFKKRLTTLEGKLNS